jgi:hypothetical protein
VRAFYGTYILKDNDNDNDSYKYDNRKQNRKTGECKYAYQANGDYKFQQFNEGDGRYNYTMLCSGKAVKESWEWV